MARDIYHKAVRHALEQDGWTITHDPYPLQLSRLVVFDPTIEIITSWFE